MSLGREMGRDGLQPSMLAGRYRLLGPLGRGGMAEVHLAHDDLLERDVAVKVLLAEFVADESFLARFRREARAAAALNHPNIVAVHDTGDEGGAPFIVMELVHGRSLAALLSDEGVGRRWALEICAEVCSALAYAHDRGIVHLDIKPGNILIAADGATKVTDFGIARAAGSEALTGTSVLGTASYLSPEQARSETVDGRSDLYSLGIVLYELVTGRVPFRGSSPLQVALKHVADSPQRPGELTDLDPALEALILKALAKDPAERHRSAQEFRAELVALLAPTEATPADTGLLVPTTIPETSDLEVRDDGLKRRPGWVQGVKRRPGWPDLGTRGRRRSRRRSYLTGGMLALVGLAVLALLGSSGRVSVPSVVGISEDEARRKVEAERLILTVAARVSSLTVPDGHVISSDPAEGTVVDEGHPVAVIVSTGPPPPPAVVPRPPPSPRGEGAVNDQGAGRSDVADQSERLKDKIEQAEDAAEEAEDAAEEAAEEAEDRAEDDGKNGGRGRR